MSISTSPSPLLASSAHPNSTHHIHPHTTTNSASSSPGQYQHHQRSPVQQQQSTSTHTHLHLQSQSQSHSASPSMLPREGSQAPPSLPTPAVSAAGPSSNTLASLSSMLANALQENEQLRADLSLALNRAAKAERLVNSFRNAASNNGDECSKGPNTGNGAGNAIASSPNAGAKNNDNTNGSDGCDISQCGYLSENTVKIIMDYDERLEKSERSQEYLHQKVQSLLASWSELDRYLSLIEIRGQDARMAFGRDVVAQLENSTGAFRFGLGESGNPAVGGGQSRERDAGGQGLSLPMMPPPLSASSKHGAANTNLVGNNSSSSSFGSLTLPPILPGSNSSSQQHHPQSQLQSQSQSRPSSSHLQLHLPAPFSHTQRGLQEHGSQSINAQRRFPIESSQHIPHPPQLQLQSAHAVSQPSSAPNSGSASGYWTTAPNTFQALPLPPPPSATVGANFASRQTQLHGGAAVAIGQKRSFETASGVDAEVDGAEEMDSVEMLSRQGRKRSRRDRERRVDNASTSAPVQQQQHYLSQVDSANGIMTNGNGNGEGRQHMYANPPLSRERTVFLAQQQQQQQQMQSMQDRDTQATVHIRGSHHKDKTFNQIAGVTVNGQRHARGRDASKDRRKTGRDRSLSVSSQAESVVSTSSTMSIDEMLLAASGSGSGGAEGTTNTQLMTLSTSSSLAARSGSKRLSPASSQMHIQANSPSPFTGNMNGHANLNERLQAVRPDPHIGPHREPPSVGEYQVHIFAEPVTAAPPPLSVSTSNSNISTSKQRNKPVPTASQARRSGSITSERGIQTSTSHPALAASNLNPPPNVTPLPSGSYPATNDLGQRICRQCGVAGRYKDGKCVEKWGPGPEGPGTVCDRCRKKMKRIARMGGNDPLSSTLSQRSAPQSLSQSQGGRRLQSNSSVNLRSLSNAQSQSLQGDIDIRSKNNATSAAASSQLPLRQQDTIVVSSESQESADARQVDVRNNRRPMMTPPYITSISTKEQHASTRPRRGESDDDGEDLDAEAEVEDDTQVDLNASSRKGAMQQRRRGGGQSRLSPQTSNVRSPPNASDSVVSADAEVKPRSPPFEGQTRGRLTGAANNRSPPKESRGADDAGDVDADADAEAENEVDVDEDIVSILPSTKLANNKSVNSTAQNRPSPTSITNRVSKENTIPVIVQTRPPKESAQQLRSHTEINNSSATPDISALPSIHTATDDMIRMSAVRGEVKTESS